MISPNNKPTNWDES